VREICGNSQESCKIVFHKFFRQHFEQDHHSIQMTDNFALHGEHCSPISEHSTALPYSSFTHYILDINRAKFTKDSCRIHVFSLKKADTFFILITA
jgi:hypothetical protein